MIKSPGQKNVRERPTSNAPPGRQIDQTSLPNTRLSLYHSTHNNPAAPAAYLNNALFPKAIELEAQRARSIVSDKPSPRTQLRGPNMVVQLGAKPLAGFDRPIDMLIDCHRRIEHFLDVIVRVVELYSNQALDAEARQAITAARHYFANSAPNHTADEEQSLFPRMHSAGAFEPDTYELLDRLQQDHRTADDLHSRIDRLLDQWLATEEALSADLLTILRTDVAELQRLYATHIHTEEEQIFPSAAKALNASQLREMGAEMRARRGLNIEALPQPNSQAKDGFAIR